MKYQRWMLRCAAIAGLLMAGTVVAVAQAGNSSAASSKQKLTQPADLNERMVRFCRERLGKRVGDGQCTALAADALAAAGAETHFKDAPASGDYVWGTLLCKLEVKDGKQSLEVSEAGKSLDKHRRTNVKAGDIIQFRDAEFHGRRGQSIYHITTHHHTAVIQQVSEDGATCKVLEQNWGDKLYVTENVYTLPDLSAGWLRVYRPLEKSSAPTAKH